MKLGTFKLGNGQFKAPIDIAIDPANNVYVSDSDNNGFKFLIIMVPSHSIWNTVHYMKGLRIFGIALDCEGDVYFN